MSYQGARAEVSVWCLLALTGLTVAGQAECADLPAAGNILVATQRAPDPDFARTVILIVHSGEEGVMGFMLNRPSGFPISKLFPETKSTAAGKAPLYLGGFVAQGVRAVLRSSSPPHDARRLFNDVWLILDATQVEKLARAGERSTVFHAYAGYAGWSQSQLRKELLLGHWQVVPGTAATVFDPHPETLWRRLSNRAH
jgi:putative transcriptional regulator